MAARRLRSRSRGLSQLRNSMPTEAPGRIDLRTLRAAAIPSRPSDSERSTSPASMARSSAAAPLRAIEAGEVDLSLSLGREGIAAARNVRKSILPGASVGMLFLNCDSPRLRDRNLRAAIAHSIDRLQVAKCCYANALAFVATSVTPRPLGPADD